MLFVRALRNLAVTNQSDASNLMSSFVAPIVKGLSIIATLACVFFLVNGGIHYITSRGNPNQLEHAKKIIKNALVGLLIVLAAGTLTAILSHAYGNSIVHVNLNLPTLTDVKPVPVSNGLIDILIKTVSGLLNNIIQSVAAPFLSALAFFTNSTPLMANNSSVFSLWLIIVGISDALFVLVIVLLGFHIMSFATFGLDEVEFKHLLPRLAGIFLLVNTSLFLIDGIVELSNRMIHVLNASLSGNSVWATLSEVVKRSGGLSVAALLIMVIFVILAVILLVYYVGRLVTLYIGTVLSPLIFLMWLVPGFRDFSENAAKTFVTTIFVLFVHVVILELAASLLTGMITDGSIQSTNTLMAMVVGLATVIALLKTQGVMTQLSYASIGPKAARRLGGQFMTGVSYITSGGSGYGTTAQSVNSKFNNPKYINHANRVHISKTTMSDRPGAHKNSSGKSALGGAFKTHSVSSPTKAIRKS